MSGHIAYSFLGQKYQRGVVLQHIVKEQFEVIAGLDIGHGESVAYVYRKNTDGNWVVENLKMDEDGHFTVPSCIGYSSGKPEIGRAVQNDLSFFQYFKLEPDQWEEPADHTHSFGDLMRDYIAVLWQGVLQFNPVVEKAQREDTLLIAVGCPASSKWTKQESLKKYVGLVAEATGCGHVSILPESTAAIMTPIFTNSAKPALGVAVYDFGSSTIDFTYVLMGKTLIARSLRLGGSDIDRAMLRKVLRDNGAAEADIPLGQKPSILTQLRVTKEDFFSTGKTQPRKSIELLKADAAGRAIPNEYANREFKYIVNADFMRQVLWKDRENQLDDPAYQGKSWGECCDKFFEFTHGLMQGLPCEAIVFTGGTSRVSDTPGIAEKYYSLPILREKDPSASVAKGLCYAKGIESRAKPEIDAAEEEIKKVSVPSFNKAMDSFSEFFVGRALVKFATAADKFVDGKKHTAADVVDAMMAEVKRDRHLLGDAEKELAVLFREAGITCQEAINKNVNEVSQKLYKTALTDAIRPPALEVHLGEDILQNLDFSGIINSVVYGTAYATIDAATGWGGVGSIGMILAGIATGNPALIGGGIAALLASIGADALNNALHEELSPTKCGKLRNRLKKLSEDGRTGRENAKGRSETVDKVSAILREDKPLRDIFDGMISEQFEISLGAVLFLVFENEDQQ